MFILKPDYPHLALLSGLLGAATALLALPGVVAPARAAAWWRRFPRSVWPGRVLAVASLAWAALWAPFVMLEFFQGAAARMFPWVQVAFLALAAGVILAMPDLLSCRAAGMLFVLVPTPLLSAARWHPSPARLLVVLAAYAMAVAGMFWIAKPWILRDWILAANATPRRARAVSAAFLALGLALLICALLAFPLAPDARPLS